MCIMRGHYHKASNCTNASLKNRNLTSPYCLKDCNCEEPEIKNIPEVVYVPRNVNYQDHTCSKQFSDSTFHAPGKEKSKHSNACSTFFKQPPSEISMSESEEIEYRKKVVCLLQANGATTLTTKSLNIGELIKHNSETEQEDDSENALRKRVTFQNCSWQTKYLEARLCSLEVRNYYLKLNCLKLERHLGLARSSFTRDL